MRLFSVLILVLFVAINPLSGFGQGISVSPSRLFFKGEPGQTASLPVTFVNHTDKELTFVPGLRDWNRDSLGVKKYFRAGQLEQSNADWVSLSESTVRLAPRQAKIVNVTLAIPADKGKRALSSSMLFFTQVKEQTKVAAKKGLGINVVVEIGIQIYHTPAGLPAGNLEFLAFQDRGFSTTSTTLGKKIRQIAIKVKNSGKINKDAYVRFELTNKESGKEVKINPIAIAMLPDAEQWISIDLPGDLKGLFLGGRSPYWEALLKWH